MKHKPDYVRIHELEYELGYRDDMPITDIPGSIRWYYDQTYNPHPAQLYNDEREAAERDTQAAEGVGA